MAKVKLNSNGEYVLVEEQPSIQDPIEEQEVYNEEVMNDQLKERAAVGPEREPAQPTVSSTETTDDTGIETAPLENVEEVPATDATQVVTPASAAQPAQQSAEPAQTSTTPVSTPLVPVQETSSSKTTTTTEEVAPEEKKAYEDALAARLEGDKQNLATLRDMMNAWKPETEEQRAARERQDRIRDNIVAASSMGAALGNLITASSRDGRSVRVAPLNAGLEQEKAKERSIRDARDARGIQLRNQYMSMRQKMLDDQLANTWNAYRQKVQEDFNTKKLAADKAKAEAAQEQRAKELAERHRHNLQLEGVADKNAETARQRAINAGLKKSNGGSGKNTNIRILGRGNSADQKYVWEVNSATGKSDMFIGSLAGFLTTIDEMNRRGIVIGTKYKTAIAQLPSNKDDQLYNTSLLKIISEYANDYQEHVEHPEAWAEFVSTMDVYDIRNKPEDNPTPSGTIKLENVSIEQKGEPNNAGPKKISALWKNKK